MNILIGITGGIAAYKIPELVRLLVKSGHNVKCIATRHALEFVTELTLETVSNNKVYHDVFGTHNDHTTEHISLKDWGDMLLVAPATANIIGKWANGIGDDALSTLLLSFSGKPSYVSPAMNSQMWQSPAVQRNLQTLRSYGVQVIDPESGVLACGATGAGRMPSPETLHAILTGSGSQSLSGRRVLVTAGPTYEKIDPVRFIGNYSSGKMGFAIAESLANEGSEVILIAGPTHLTCSHPNIRRIDVESAVEMFNAATQAFPECDAAILSAAVADYRPASQADEKIKKKGDAGLHIDLVQNPDILASLGAMKRPHQLLVGFALETHDEEQNAKSKLNRKNLDFIVLNSLRDKGAGFGTDTNKITIIDKNGTTETSALKSKREIADDIVRHLATKITHTETRSL